MIVLLCLAASASACLCSFLLGRFTILAYKTADLRLQILLFAVIALLGLLCAALPLLIAALQFSDLVLPVLGADSRHSVPRLILAIVTLAYWLILYGAFQAGSRRYDTI